MSWFRQEAAFFQNPNVILAGWHGSIVFLVACHMSKLHGWDGSIPKRHFTPDLIRRFCGALTECHSDADLTDGITRCIEADLFKDAGDSLEIRSWRKFQPDPTGAERQRRHRKKKRAERDVTERSVSNATYRQTDRQDRTDEQTDRARGAPLSVVASLPPQNGKPGGLHKGQRLSPTAWVAVGAILDCLAKGFDTTVWQQRAIAYRKQLRAGTLPDAVGSELLATFKARFAKSIAEAKEAEAAEDAPPLEPSHALSGKWERPDDIEPNTWAAFKRIAGGTDWKRKQRALELVDVPGPERGEAWASSVRDLAGEDGAGPGGPDIAGLVGDLGVGF